jgi:hypothetical protein
MIPVRIGCVVEGHGEVASVPILLRRLGEWLHPDIVVTVARPVRMTKSKLLQPGQLERAAQLAALTVENNGGILVLLDSDESCPAALGPSLLQRVKAARGDLPSAVVLAKREFEAWFLASAQSLKGQGGLAEDVITPPQPEEVAGAKEWLGDRLSRGAYSSTVDQPALTSKFDLELARGAASFGKLCRAFNQLVEELRVR